MQEYGSPSKNGLGHRETTTVHPVSKQQVKAVFIPKLKKGRWQGEIKVEQTASTENVVDDDTTALRRNQLPLGFRGFKIV